MGCSQLPNRGWELGGGGFQLSGLPESGGKPGNPWQASKERFSFARNQGRRARTALRLLADGRGNRSNAGSGESRADKDRSSLASPAFLLKTLLGSCKTRKLAGNGARPGKSPGNHASVLKKQKLTCISCRSNTRSTFPTLPLGSRHFRCTRWNARHRPIPVAAKHFGSGSFVRGPRKVGREAALLLVPLAIGESKKERKTGGWRARRCLKNCLVHSGSIWHLKARQAFYKWRME